VDLNRFIAEVVRPAVHPDRRPFEVAAFPVRGEPINAAQALLATYVPFQVGEAWGGRWDTTWFRLRATIPAAWAGAEVAALVHLGGQRMVGFSAEGLIWAGAGRPVPVQGLHHRQRQYRLTLRAQGGEPVELYVEAAANPVPRWHTSDGSDFRADYGGRPLYRLEQAELAVVDHQVAALLSDLRVVSGLADGLDSAPAREALHAAVKCVDATDVAATAGAAREALAPVLAAPSDSEHVVTAVGHAHIDTAWLWPIRETKRKCARTFSNQLRLLDSYAEHRFVCSQAVQYQWMKDDYPDLYQQITARVAGGRWEPVGGMWVEPDTNMPSGESLVRQVVYGKRFFADEFGVDAQELWIPDVFGYSAALPQVAAQAGVTSLITQKLSWNDTNVFPHSTFWWEGHDGSRLLAHFPPANTYNGDFSVRELLDSQRHFQEHGRSDRSLYPYGYGDGGGGPTAEMLESGRRVADLEGLPHVEIDSVKSFLDRLRQDPGLATWVGELYLETHRGTLTTHADVKVGNRRAEEALRAAEMWSVAAGIDRRAALEGAWKRLLVQQFHDILPGSSIGWVYEDCAREQAEVLRCAGEVSAESRAVLAGPGEGLVAFNPSSWDRHEVAEFPDGRLGIVRVPACGWATETGGATANTSERGSASEGGSATEGATAREGASAAVASLPVEVGAGWMANGLVEIRWDQDGLITSILDVPWDRQVLAEGERGNLFQLHEDHPQAFDAWNVDRDYLDQVADLVSVESIDIVERDPLRAGVRLVRRFGRSTITQTMQLAAGSRRIEFHTEVDWHERHRFLKVAFPVAVRSARATYEIQHGHIERPTVVNTSWDEARYEVCGHRWADLSEAGYGVALLNNCKYGYDIRGHVMRLSLLRAPAYPDPDADQGRHRFAYALLPHAGPFQDSVIAQAEFFNLPLVFVPGAAEGRVVTVDGPGVSVEAVKWADRADGIVVRLCEVWGGRRPVRVTVHAPFRSVMRVDLLEREVGTVAVDAGAAVVSLRPFELVSLLFG
jgi:alpha-mannosidase